MNKQRAASATTVAADVDDEGNNIIALKLSGFLCAVVAVVAAAVVVVWLYHVLTQTITSRHTKMILKDRKLRRFMLSPLFYRLPGILVVTVRKIHIDMIHTVKEGRHQKISFYFSVRREGRLGGNNDCFDTSVVVGTDCTVVMW